MGCVEELGREWVAGCKSNRLILMGGWTPISSYIGAVLRSKYREVTIRTKKGERRFWTYAKDVTMKGRWRVRIVASYENPELKGEPKMDEDGLATVGSRCRYAAMEFLKSFIELVVKLARNVRNPEEILKMTKSDLKGLKTLYQMEIT